MESEDPSSPDALTSRESLLPVPRVAASGETDSSCGRRPALGSVVRMEDISPPFTSTMSPRTCICRGARRRGRVQSWVSTESSQLGRHPAAPTCMHGVTPASGALERKRSARSRPLDRSSLRAARGACAGSVRFKRRPGWPATRRPARSPLGVGATRQQHVERELHAARPDVALECTVGRLQHRHQLRQQAGRQHL